MTEAVILALIALIGCLIFSVTTIILINVFIKNSPTYFKFWTAYGYFEMKSDNKADGLR